MNRTPYDAQSMHGGLVSFLAAFVGAGAAVPTIPATTVIPAADNFGTATGSSRTSEGLYVLALKEKFVRILHVAPVITRASGALKHVNVVSWSEADATVTVQVSLANGSGVDDIETTDTLRLWVHARKEDY